MRRTLLRYILIAYLAKLGWYDELEKFMKKGDYRDDCAAEWVYTKALLAFVRMRDSKIAQNQLKAALRLNNMHLII